MNTTALLTEENIQELEVVKEFEAMERKLFGKAWEMKLGEIESLQDSIFKASLG